MLPRRTKLQIPRVPEMTGTQNCILGTRELEEKLGWEHTHLPPGEFPCGRGGAPRSEKRFITQIAQCWGAPQGFFSNW